MSSRRRDPDLRGADALASNRGKGKECCQFLRTGVSGAFKDSYMGATSSSVQQQYYNSAFCNFTLELSEPVGL